jgi:hypothetical protein
VHRKLSHMVTLWAASSGRASVVKESNLSEDVELDDAWQDVLNLIVVRYHIHI